MGPGRSCTRTATSPPGSACSDNTSDGVAVRPSLRLLHGARRPVQAVGAIPPGWRQRVTHGGYGEGPRIGAISGSRSHSTAGLRRPLAPVLSKPDRHYGAPGQERRTRGVSNPAVCVVGGAGLEPATSAL